MYSWALVTGLSGFPGTGPKTHEKQGPTELPVWESSRGSRINSTDKAKGNLITEKVCTETSKVCLEFFSSRKVILLIFTEAEALTWLNALLLFPFSAVIRDL